MSVKVSVIVPVYNAKDNISRCVNSLLAQTLDDIQIILVDDGSKDNSFEICKSFAEKDKRVTAITKLNGGVSSARNEGLRHAVGEYIGFVDSDDFVNKDMFEMLFNKAKLNLADICICGYNTVNGDNISPHLLPYDKDVYEKDEITDNFVLSLIGADYKNKKENIGGFVWRNIYKSDIVKDLTFSEKTSIMEDTLFNINAYLKADRVAVINKALINYVYEQGSLTNHYRRNFWKEIYEVLKVKKEIIKRENLPKKAYVCFYNEVIDCLVFAVKNIKRSDCTLNKSEKDKEFKNIISSDFALEAKRNLKTSGMPLKKKLLIFLMKLNLNKIIFALM